MTQKIVIVQDDFNSEIFGKKFGNIYYYDKDVEASSIRDIVIKSDYCYLGIKIDAKDSIAIYNFQKAGFYVVNCLVTYEFDSEKSQIPNDDYDIIFADEATEEDIMGLANMAAGVFKIDRFHSDPNLLQSDSDNYYRQWVINSFRGFADGVILPMIDNKIVGFTTYKINNVDKNTSTLVLSAVDFNCMGRGVYHNMIKKGTKELLKYSKKIRLGTQVNNIPVQRTWQKLGYRLIEVNYILHYVK